MQDSLASVPLRKWRNLCRWDIETRDGFRLPTMMRQQRFGGNKNFPSTSERFLSVKK